ncbi:apolipoprotein D isoform X1 [Phlebotomus papatasi]|nr:apolipoprotein D isoform X1 [Phlebotomus papatasi]
MQFLLSTIVAIWLFSSEVSASGFGRCPKYPSMPKYNMTKFTGKWYEVERSFYLPEIASGCTTLSFQPVDTSQDLEASYGKLEVAIKTVNQWTGNPSVSLGFALPESENSSIMHFQLSSRLPAALARLLPGTGKYQILFTDYDNFAILWSCFNFGFAHTDQIWLLGRDRDFVFEIRKKIYDALDQLGLDSDRLVISKNKNCPVTL